MVAEALGRDASWRRSSRFSNRSSRFSIRNSWRDRRNVAKFNCPSVNCCILTQESISLGTASTLPFSPGFVLCTGNPTSRSHLCTVRTPLPTYRSISFQLVRTDANSRSFIWQTYAPGMKCVRGSLSKIDACPSVRVCFSNQEAFSDSVTRRSRREQNCSDIDPLCLYCV
jgi:hypothetical protein